MRDPYLYEDAPVLKNKLGIKNAKKLEQVEADIVAFASADVDNTVTDMPFSLLRLLAIHKHMFASVYEWAGEIRYISIVKGERILGGDTVHYSQPDDIERDCGMALDNLNSTLWASLDVHETAEVFAKLIAALWQTHPFREGNTRTTIAFATQFAEAHSFRMDKSLLEDSAAYVRDALVKASDAEYSDYKYLSKIFEDAIRRG